MSDEARPCPYCGHALPPGFEVDRVDESTGGEAAAVRDAEPEVPTVPLIAPGSQDDSFSEVPGHLDPTSIRPDPILGRFMTPPSSGGSEPSAEVDRPSRSGSVANFPALDFGAHHPRPPSPTDDEDDDLDEVGARRASWPLVILASYASAMTLAFGWAWSRSRTAEPAAAEVAGPGAPGPVDSAHQRELSRKVGPPEPIVGERVANLGEPLTVGSLEVTPIEVKRENVTLQRAISLGKPDRKDGGRRALVLRLRLKNVSDDSAFAPLDQAYLRERGREVVDTFVETAAKERIYPFPLALESEWSIVGQDFTELRPRESRVVAIVTAPEAPGDEPAPFNWRVRLRTGIERTDVIGLCWTPKPSRPADPPRPKAGK